jgi:hypothetical protein
MIDMKSIEIENENVQRRLLSYTNEKQNEKTLNTESKGEVTIEGEYGTLKFERRFSYPIEIVWKAITDQKENLNLLSGGISGRTAIQIHSLL